MKRQAFDDLQSAIKAHSERRSIDDLAAQGKRHVRVVSSKRVLELIERIVDDAIRREALEIAEKDRDRIVSETRQQFDRAMRAQGEQDAKLREQRDRADRLEGELAEARRTIVRLESDLGIEQDAVAALRRAHEELIGDHEAELESRADRSRRQLAVAQQQVEEAEKERRRARQVAENALERGQADLEKIADLESRLATAKATIENYDAELSRLTETRRDERAEFESRTTSMVTELEQRLTASREMRERLEARAVEHEKRIEEERSERLELVERVEELRGECAELDERLSAVRGERDASMQQFATERAERAATELRLVEESQQLTAVSSELRRMQDVLAETERERDALDAARGNAESAHASVAAERDGIVSERDALATERAELVSEREALSAQRDELAAERDALVEERRALVEEREVLLRERDGLAARCDDLRARVEAASESADGRASEAERVGRLLEIEQGRVEDLRRQCHEITQRLDARDRQIAELNGELAAAREQLETARAEAQARAGVAEAARADEVDELRSDLGELKQMLAGIAARPAGTDEKTLTKIVGRLEARDDLRTSEFEERFSEQLDRTLHEVTREMRLATARPVDIAVEATDVLVDRLFDEEDQMSTNLGSLAVEERSDKRDIAGDLARLRRARGVEPAPAPVEPEVDPESVQQAARRVEREVAQEVDVS